MASVHAKDFPPAGKSRSFDQDLSLTIRELSELGESGKLDSKDRDALLSMAIAMYTFQVLGSFTDKLLTPAFMTLHRRIMSHAKYMEYQDV